MDNQVFINVEPDGDYWGEIVLKNEKMSHHIDLSLGEAKEILKKLKKELEGG